MQQMRRLFRPQQSSSEKKRCRTKRTWSLSGRFENRTCTCVNRSHLHSRSSFVLRVFHANVAKRFQTRSQVTSPPSRQNRTCRRNRYEWRKQCAARRVSRIPVHRHLCVFHHLRLFHGRNSLSNESEMNARSGLHLILEDTFRTVSTIRRSVFKIRYSRRSPVAGIDCALGRQQVSDFEAATPVAASLPLPKHRGF